MKALWTWYIDNIWCPYQKLITKMRVIKYHIKQSQFGEKLERLYYKLFLRRKIRKLNAAS
jgi:hypothetical protein